MNLCVSERSYHFFRKIYCGTAGCNPLTGTCKNYVEEGGKTGNVCSSDVYKQTCINGGANALVCRNDKVTQLDCAGGCEDAGYDPAKPLQVKCLEMGGNPGDVCDRNSYTQTCINGGANALVCWNDKVTQWNCAGGCLDAGYDPAKPLQVKCLEMGGNPGDVCDRNSYTQTCINGGANALVCWNDKVTQWNCAGGCLDAGYDPAKPLQVKCPKTGGDYDGI